ncbi:adenylyltransferase and sulfurtransferase MOCS3 isoform X3 [Oryza glaberrima]|uniref:adenylyltransferase and sulfurtransferase MOCS3 isoform X3 n=1 Tax=Oryza glaberrima TaxID=4538 RepID=UPI00224C0713|nr:adenylyltransferase and sulfurtransferase MOCS3 isoform X3 [Oryza glaberrima]
MEGGGDGDGGRSRAEAIMRELERLRAEREELDGRIRLLESQLRLGAAPLPPSAAAEVEPTGSPSSSSSAAADMISRYRRHLLLPQFGLEGQRKLSQSSILVVGAGGLGSPVAMYLAACGVGCLGIVDGDRVELDNLHRQPLISGSAVGLEGQLTVYHHNGSPCYRCLYPNPPSSPTSQSCSDNGILGILPGVIGCLQALEAIKVATAVGKPLCGRMLHFDALSSHTRIVKISRSSPTCKVCGENPVFTKEDFVNFDYESFTQSPMSKNSTTRSLNLLPENARVSCRDYKKVLDSGRPHLLVDVRPSHHFQIASMAHSINVPLSLLEEKLPLLRDSAREVSSRRDGRQHCPVYVICRRGNDSQVAVQILRENGFLYASDVAGGFESWAKEVDPSFLLY